jgi:hypothetical protein
MKIQTRSAAALLILSAMVTACASSAATAPSVNHSQVAQNTQAGAPAGDATAAASTPARGSTPAVNACAVITEQDATTLLGSDPGPGQNTSSDTGAACAYGASLTLSVGANAGKAQFDSDRAPALGSGKLQDLTGVGDAAFVFIVANTIGQMEILKGSTILTVDVQGDPALQNITAASLKTLGTAAAGRI